MRFLIFTVLWCLLLAVCWPLALLLLVLTPILVPLAVVFHLLGIAIGAVFAFIKALLFLPARLLGYR